MEEIETDLGEKSLKAAWLDTKLGSMLTIADNEGLYLLGFIDSRGLEKEVKKLRLKTNLDIREGENSVIKSIKIELDSYFSGDLITFKTRVHLLGSPFQRLAWEALMRIPYGQTQSYATQAESIGKRTAYRAVANANGANRLAIVIPCHRIINSNGKIGGYGGGLSRKQWLLDHEKQTFKGS